MLLLVSVSQVVLWLVLCHLGATSGFSGAMPGCRDTCGGIAVPYPFGIGGEGCYAEGFKMTCDDSYDPPNLFIGSTYIEVISMSPDSVLIRSWLAQQCYDKTDPSSALAEVDLRDTPFTFSYTRNRFTVVGCDGVALIYRIDHTLSFASGCMVTCAGKGSVVNGSCSGIGCCQTMIPKGLKRYDAQIGAFDSNRSTTTSTTTTTTTTVDMMISPCTYAFLIDDQQFHFSESDFYKYRERRRVPVVLDWAVGNVTCSEARRRQSVDSYLCKSNSECVDSSNGPGYRCTCNKGYQGNPYLTNGCQDINECEDPNISSPCAENMNCINTPGSYICSCKQGYTTVLNGTGCTSRTKPAAFPLVQTVLGSGLGLMSLLIASSLLCWGVKGRRLTQLREKMFKQNGGLLLQQHMISLHKGGTAAENFRIFTEAELAKATANYSQSRIVGRGGFGTVYKGVLPDNRIVAIKKSMVVDKAQVEQFINEVVILSQAIHRNLVKILGCCLETHVPLLVYEFVPNGTLTHHLEPSPSTLSWESRLRIAIETAGALAYLHSATSRPIIHRDVKSANILLDILPSCQGRTVQILQL